MQIYSTHLGHSEAWNFLNLAGYFTIHKDLIKIVLPGKLAWFVTGWHILWKISLIWSKITSPTDAVACIPCHMLVRIYQAVDLRTPADHHRWPIHSGLLTADSSVHLLCTCSHPTVSPKFSSINSPSFLPTHQFTVLSAAGSFANLPSSCLPGWQIIIAHYKTYVTKKTQLLKYSFI